MLKALGRRSVASIVRGGLELLWWALGLAALGLVIAWLLFLARLMAFAVGLADSADLFDVAWPQATTALLVGAVTVAGALVIVGRLRRLFGNFISGEPFSADNADHLRMIWIAMLAMEIARYAIAAGVATLVATLGHPEGLKLSVHVPPINLSAWGAILVLIVLAEVFREGARLRDADKLTI